MRDPGRRSRALKSCLNMNTLSPAQWGYNAGRFLWCSFSRFITRRNLSGASEAK